MSMTNSCVSNLNLLQSEFSDSITLLNDTQELSTKNQKNTIKIQDMLLEGLSHMEDRLQDFHETVEQVQKDFVSISGVISLIIDNILASTLSKALFNSFNCSLLNSLILGI